MAEAVWVSVNNAKPHAARLCIEYFGGFSLVLVDRVLLVREGLVDED